MDRLDILLNELTSICSEIEESMETVSKLEPVTYLSQAKIQFQGGILGGIREYRENKRLEKLINAPIYKGKSFVTYAVYLAESSEKIVKILSEVQGLLTKEDDRYHGLVAASFATVNDALNIWYHYSPDLSTVTLNLRGQAEELRGGIRRWIKEEYCKLDLPDSMQSLKKPEIPQKESSGCFGALMVLLTAASGLVATLIFIF